MRFFASTPIVFVYTTRSRRSLFTAVAVLASKRIAARVEKDREERLFCSSVDWSARIYIENNRIEQVFVLSMNSEDHAGECLFEFGCSGVLSSNVGLTF